MVRNLFALESSHFILKAQNLSIVSHPKMPIKSYAGYFTVNKEYNSNLFFWFFPAKENASDAPVLLWLQGQHICIIFQLRLQVMVSNDIF